MRAIRWAEIANALLNLPNNYNINIKYLRGQSLDIPYNMAGFYVGLQARIKTVNQLARFVSCAAVFNFNWNK